MCQFTLSFSADANSLVNRASGEIARSGGVFQGDSSQGNFRAKTPIGSIEGAYVIEGQNISLTITKKPLLLSCKRIEKELSGIMK